MCILDPLHLTYLFVVKLFLFLRRQTHVEVTIEASYDFLNLA